MQFDIPTSDVDHEHFLAALSIYLYKPHVINKRVTTVRFAPALDRADRRYSTGTNSVHRRSLISKNPRIYHDQEEYVLIDGASFEFRPIAFASSTKTCGVQLSGYRFEFLAHEHLVRLTVFDEQPEKEILWLKDILLAKIVKWSRSEISNSSKNSTLKLISIEDYQREYERLKVKYGKYLTANWCENTDPQKHVFEDLGTSAKLRGSSTLLFLQASRVIY